jgi:Fe-Mn family superoxide dismutase
MAFELQALPYARNALEPHMSTETLDYHYGKHNQTYITKLNGLIEGTDDANKSLEDIVRSASGAVFNNAAQAWNHNFFWQCMSPNGGNEPTGAAKDAIEKDFGSFDDFKNEFNEKAASNFGSGWTWLVKKADGSIAISNTSNAENPLTGADKAVLTIDVWEHAYYLDHRNSRPDYLAAYWKLVNWDFVNENLA